MLKITVSSVIQWHSAKNGNKQMRPYQIKKTLYHKINHGQNKISHKLKENICPAPI